MPSRLSTSGFAPPIRERIIDKRHCLQPSTSGCRCNLIGRHHQQCRSRAIHGLYMEGQPRVSTTMLTRLVKIALPIMGVVLTILLSCSSAPAQVIDKNIYLPPQYQTLAPPAEGASYVDPAFGTSIKRISNALVQPNIDRGGMLTFITDEYSTMSSFNQDNSKILLVFQSYFGLYDGTGAFLKNCPLEVSASSEPRWSRTDRDVFYYHRGNELRSYNTATDKIATLHVFGEYGSISGKGESDISSDGNHFVLVGDDRYIFVYEISSDTKGPLFDAGSNAFDSVYMTPDNNVTVTWLQPGSGRYNGIELFDRNMSFLRQVSRVGGHMDVTRDTSGEEILVMINAADPTPVCNNGIVKIRLADAHPSCLLSLDWSLAVHVSAPDGNGSVFVETYAPSDPVTTPSWAVYTNEILQIKLDGTEVRRLAHHRSRPFNSYNYQPHVSASRDGSRLIYNSNFGLQATAGYPTEYSDVYFIAVSSGTGTDPGRQSTATSFEQDNPAIIYSGPWYSNTSAGHSGGSANLAMDTGARATLTFYGSAVAWVGYRDEWSGIANVYLDGQFQRTVDTSASPSKFQSILYTQSGLSESSHTLSIEATGTTNSGGSWIWIDAFLVSSQNVPVPAAKTRIEQNVPSVSSSGSWHSKSMSALSGGSAILAMDTGSRASLSFTGTGISWIGYTDAWSGIANVSIDNNSPIRVDTYSSSDVAQAKAFNIGGLVRGNHTITIEVTGQKNRLSRGRWIWLDAFDVSP